MVCAVDNARRTVLWNDMPIPSINACAVVLNIRITSAALGSRSAAAEPHSPPKEWVGTLKPSACRFSVGKYRAPFARLPSCALGGAADNEAPCESILVCCRVPRGDFFPYGFYACVGLAEN